jgi:hypothetical protein
VAALAAAALVFTAVTAPPRHLTLSDTPDGTIAGILHVHTNRSDGSSSPETIAAAAARAGLRFIVFTDHGDGTRPPDPPAYRSGVLCVDGVEISTTGGHYIALDMPAAPYPLAGEPRDVVDDVRRLGGFGIVAHPDSPKPSLRWTDWTAPFDGVELVNLDTNWRRLVDQLQDRGASFASRRHALRRIATTLLAYPFRAPETIASITPRDDDLLARFESIAATRRLVAAAGADAHARIAYRGDPWDIRSGLSVPVPSYETAFRALSVHASVERPLTADAPRDARLLMRALREGHFYTALDGIAVPPSFEIAATNSRGTVHEGDELGVGGPVIIRVRSNAPAGFTTNVWRGSTIVSGGHHEPEFAVDVGSEPAVYWASIEAPGGGEAVTWLRSNPIFVRGPSERAPEAPNPAGQIVQPLFDGTSAAGWRVEHDAASATAVEIAQAPGGPELRWRYALGGGPPGGQFATLACDLPQGAGASDRLAVTIRADRPMRLSVQLRDPAGANGGARWQRSIYVANASEDHLVRLDELKPTAEGEAARPTLETIRSVLFVVDTTNTKPGTAGRVWIKSAALER